MDPVLHSSRVSRLKKRFLDVLSGSVKLDPRGATLFLEGICVQDDPVGCLGAIVKSAYGLTSVQSAMRFDLSVQFMNGLGSVVLAYLLRAGDVGGGTLDNLLVQVVEPPIFWTPFVRAFQQGELSEDAQLVFARVLSRLLTLHDRDTTPYREVAAQLFIEDRLIASPKHEIREMGQLIKHILSSTTSMTLYDALNGPGGRHDNDFADYHDISILPTADEIMCRKPPFLCTSDHDLTASETSVKGYLDNTFRMLREDMLFDIREETQAISQQGRGKHRGLHVIGCVSVVGVYTGMDDRKTLWGVKLRSNTDFKELKKIRGADSRADFLRRDPRGSKILKHQSLVCLVSGKDILCFGTVNRVEQLLASQPPIIVLQLDGAVNAKKALTSLCTIKTIRLIQLNIATFSFEPVLSALQKMDSVPLAEEIISWNPEMPILGGRKSDGLSHVANAVISNLSVDLRSLLDLPTSIRLDKSQAKSLITSLTKRVSLIQGPPGTGKSFIGTILAKAIHDKTSHTILIVCYTNHALDQFLGDLLRYNIPSASIVRLGGRPNQSMEHLSLHKQPRGRTRYNWEAIDNLKRTASLQEHGLESHFDTLLAVNDNKNLISYLKLHHPQFFEAFYVPLETEDGMTRVGRNGQVIDEEYLFSRWTQGHNAGVLSDDPHVQASARIWGMDHSARQQLLAKWRQELVTKAIWSICRAGLKYNELQDAIKHHFDESTVAVLKQKRIIACTTTGAAIYAEAIKKAGPKFLLVEEAGEILESHILTALSPKVDQMILIGDHKQLRPKINNYQLTVEYGEGFDLNRSLFERLVLKGYPHETLSTQHRMRPEISAFVRELTYPELIDAPATHRRSDIRGVPSNIIFIDHDHPEDDDARVGDRTDGGAKSSKRNTYEVQMVLKIVRYLAQQGYKGEDIVVLTPYLGQLHQLRDALKRDNDPILNDMDSLDLARAGISTSAPSEAKTKKGRIHLATIDNYQGEESDIVVASLTRSNTSNAIGFMDSPERLNVLLSRARDGLILIGNSKTFLHSKKGGALWKRLFALIDKGKYAYQGFPVKCERHPERIVLLKRASDFDSLCPEGGCMEPCGFTLTCGHTCPKKCHPRPSPVLLDPHDAAQCTQKKSDTCAAGRHRITWGCRFTRPAECVACIGEAKRLEAIAAQALEQQRKRDEAEAEHRRQMKELEEAKLRAEKATREEERKLEEDRRKRKEEALKKQREEEKRKRKEEQRRPKGKRQRQVEKRRREERKKGREEKRRAAEKKICEAKKKKMRAQKRKERKAKTKQLKKAARQRQEEMRKQKEEAKRLQEAARRRQEEEERRRREGEIQRREEETRRLLEAIHRRQEEERKRQEDARVREEIENREEQVRRLQEAARKRREEAEQERREEERREREERAERLREVMRKRWEEELRIQQEEIRTEQAVRLQEATNRRREEEELRIQQEEIRTEQAVRLQEATNRRREEEERRIYAEQMRNRERQARRLIESPRVNVRRTESSDSSRNCSVQ